MFKFITLIFFILVAFYVYKTEFMRTNPSGKRTYTNAQIRNIALACEAYYEDFQTFPSFHELKGQNKLKKEYYTGKEKNINGGVIHVELDLDKDGLVSYKEKMIKRKVIVWTEFLGRTLKSWDSTEEKEN